MPSWEVIDKNTGRLLSPAVASHLGNVLMLTFIEKFHFISNSGRNEFLDVVTL